MKAKIQAPITDAQMDQLRKLLAESNQKVQALMRRLNPNVDPKTLLGKLSHALLPSCTQAELHVIKDFFVAFKEKVVGQKPGKHPHKLAAGKQKI